MGTFFGISGLATDIQNKQIAFVGDRAPGHFSVPFIFLPTNLWTWTMAHILRDTARFKAYYDNKKTKGNCGSQEHWELS
jgi:hypothetical protein